MVWGIVGLKLNITGLNTRKAVIWMPIAHNAQHILMINGALERKGETFSVWQKILIVI